jgi:RNA polymerase sigma-70 factor (ECF subfamily)
MLKANALMAQTVEIQSDAFMEAIDPLLPMGYRLACGLLRNRDEADDIMQEATLNAWKHRRSLRAGSPVRPWFLAIVANQCRQTVRTRWWSVIRRPDLASAVRQENESDRDDVESLRRGLLTLKGSDRLVLVLRYYVDLSFDDVAAVLHISPQTARVRTHRALARLKPIVDVPGDLSHE